MNQHLVHIITATSEFSRPTDLPVHGMCPNWGPIVSLEVLQTQAGPSRWGEPHQSSCQTTMVFLVRGGVTEVPANSLRSSRWGKDSPMLPACCWAPPGGGSGYWQYQLCHYFRVFFFCRYLIFYTLGCLPYPVSRRQFCIFSITYWYCCSFQCSVWVWAPTPY